MSSPPLLRVGFAGTPAFAAAALKAIISAGFAVPVVLTQPDRPRGRGMQVDASPVKQLALQHAIPVQQPASLKADDARAAALAVPLDVLVVAAYGLILPRAILDWPRHGCINIHASLLPRWRGAAPIPRAIAAGDAATGVTIMQMDAGLDTGPMIATVPMYHLGDLKTAARESKKAYEIGLETGDYSAVCISLLFWVPCALNQIPRGAIQNSRGHWRGNRLQRVKDKPTGKLG